MHDATAVCFPSFFFFFIIVKYVRNCNNEMEASAEHGVATISFTNSYKLMSSPGDAHFRSWAGDKAIYDMNVSKWWMEPKQSAAAVRLMERSKLILIAAIAMKSIRWAAHHRSYIKLRLTPSGDSEFRVGIGGDGKKNNRAHPVFLWNCAMRQKAAAGEWSRSRPVARSKGPWTVRVWSARVPAFTWRCCHSFDRRSGLACTDTIYKAVKSTQRSFFASPWTKNKWKMCFLFTSLRYFNSRLIICSTPTSSSSFVFFSSSFESHILWRSQTIRRSKSMKKKNNK